MRLSPGMAGLFVAMVVSTALANAHAEVRRYALLVGANRGLAHEAPLRYAETDVDAVADTLARLGGYPTERVVRLIAPTAARVRGALVDLNLEIQEQVRGGHEAVLFVYYSGHADAQTLHLGSSELASEEFSKLVRLSPAKLKILLLDACRAGALTRVKGGRQVAPFQIGLQDRLRNEGYAIVTSSSAGEDAQESDALRSSIFTHHFLGALRGLGDVNGDRQVTLGEAYAYAYQQSLKTSMGTVAGSQHATFDYDLRGRADPVLTDLRTVGDHAQLLLATPGEYLILSPETGAVLLEANVKEARTPVVLPAARYQVRMRTRTNVYQGEVMLRSGEATLVAEDSLRPLPFAQVVRKGETEARLAQGPTVVGSVHGGLARGFSPMVGAQLGWAFELRRITLMPRLGFATGRSLKLGENVSRHSLTEISAELTALYVLDWGWLSLAPSVSVGGGLLQQTLDKGAGCAQDCRMTAEPLALITTVGAWSMLPLGAGVTIEGTIELANFYLKQQQQTKAFDPMAPRLGTLTWRAGIGLGYRF